MKANMEKVPQPSRMPTRKVALGAANGAGALVGVNVLLMWWVGHVYGSADAVPQSVFNLLLWVNGIITWTFHTFAGWFVSEVRPRLAYAIEHALDEHLPRPPAETALVDLADAATDAANELRDARAPNQEPE